MRAWVRSLLIAAVLLGGSAVSARAQNCVTLNGSQRCAGTFALVPQAQPASRVEGTYYYDSAAHAYKVWNGTAWVSIGTISGNSLGTTSTDGLVLQNTTASNGTTTVQISPRMKWCGTAWNSTSSVSETDCMFIEALPQTNAGTTTAMFKVGYINPAGTVTYPATLSSAGQLVTLGNIVGPSGGSIGMGSSFFLTGNTSGVFLIRNDAINSGVAADVTNDGMFTILNRSATALTGQISAGAARVTPGSGTGITISNPGALQTQIYEVTVASTNFIAAAVTADVTLATLPAKGIVQWMIADLTTTFACTGTCTTATLSMTCGKTAGGNEYLVSFDADAATGQFGTTQAAEGASLKTATPPNTALGDLPNWSGTTAIQCRLTSGTGNIGTGAATNLSQGTIKFYIATTLLP